MPTRSLSLLFAVLAALPAMAEPPESLRVAAPGVFVGALPEGEAQWDALAKLGVKTVVGVDGLPPDASAAKRHGIRPVHVPIGYDGIDEGAAGQFTRVAREADRPVYIYCHHGHHRGPAAAAVVCRAAGLMDEAAATKLLRDAGTNPDYGGLWRDVAAYRPPPEGAELPPLKDRSDVDPLPLAMGQLDAAWDVATATSEKRTRHESLVLTREALRESRRAAAEEGGSDELVKAFDEAQFLFKQVQEAPNPAAFDAAAKAFAASCVGCHAKHRD